ncbi:MAG: hypothetical protein MZU84_04630 [Sphingobacterium sp.]|nr:hypothetical protein [Sphingobacterium sp.]
MARVGTPPQGLAHSGGEGLNGQFSPLPVRREVPRDGEDDRLAVREDLRQPVAHLVLGFVERRQRQGRSACGGHAHEAAAFAPEHDGVIRTPAGAEDRGRVADGSDRTSAGRRLLQRLTRPEADPLPVGREERTSAAFRALQRHGLELVERAPEQPLLAAADGAERQPSPVGRQRDGGAARTAAVARLIVGGRAELVGRCDADQRSHHIGAVLAGRRTQCLEQRDATDRRHDRRRCRERAAPCASTSARSGRVASVAPLPCEIHRSSSAAPCAESQRSSGFFARHFVMTRASAGGVGGCSDASGAGSCSRIAAATFVGVSPSNARRPVTISWSTAPSAQMSVRASAGLPSTCSGAM